MLQIKLFKTLITTLKCKLLSWTVNESVCNYNSATVAYAGHSCSLIPSETLTFSSTSVTWLPLPVICLIAMVIVRNTGWKLLIRKVDSGWDGDSLLIFNCFTVLLCQNVKTKGTEIINVCL